MASDPFSLVRLGHMHDVMAGYVDQGEVPGLVTALSRGGEVHVEALGCQAVGGAPMRRDTLFRIASLTKPIVAATTLRLVERCDLRLDDPVDRWLPELAARRVLRSLDGPLDDTVPASRPITVRDLLTLRCGYGAVLGPPEAFPVQEAMAKAGLAPGAALPSVDADELMRRFGSLPLAHQPGDGWLYHSGFDLLGVLLGRVTGRALGDLLRDELFDPLGMADTAFWVPPASVRRLATAYTADTSDGALTVFDAAEGGRFVQPPVFEAGGGGLVSTADDLLAFFSMLLGGGMYRGRRVLSRAAVSVMTTDHLTATQRAAGDPILGGSGWGFGVAIDLRRDTLYSAPGRYGWNGGYGTSAYVDPGEGLVGILLTQRLMTSPSPPPVYQDFWTAAYHAIED